MEVRGKIIHWLTGESGAGWIIGILSSVCTVWWQRQQQEPNVVRLEEIAEVRLLEVQSNI